VIVAPLDAVAPVTPPVIAPMVQLKMAPVTLLARAMLVAVALQIVRGLAVVTFGFGLTVTVTVKDDPVQLPDVGITVYVAVSTAFVGLTRVPLIFAAAVPAAPPEIPPVTTGATQV